MYVLYCMLVHSLSRYVCVGLFLTVSGELSLSLCVRVCVCVYRLTKLTPLANPALQKKNVLKLPPPSVKAKTPTLPSPKSKHTSASTKPKYAE